MEVKQYKLKTIQDGKSIQSLVKEFVDIYLNSGKTATELLNELKIALD